MFRSIIGSLILASFLLAGSLPAGGAGVEKAKPKALKAKVAAVQAEHQLQQSAGSSLKILGDSTLHKWEALAQSLTISAVREGEQYKSLNLAVAAGSLKSNENDSMDKNMYKALETAKFPEISFTMSGYEVQGASVTAKGQLVIHGVSKEIELSGILSQAEGGAAVRGSYDLLMSDYGIKPPVMMLGTVRVADKVSIAYDFTLEPRP